MPNVFRFRRLPHAPEPNRNSEAIFAASDGTLKHVDPDGNVTNVAGEGSLPSPTSEGDVLTVVEGDWAGEAPSGGSLPDVDAASVGDFLEVSSTPSDNLTPTLAEIDAALANDPNLGTGLRVAAGWQAEHDYAADLHTDDGVQFLVPDGVLNVFAAEVNGGLTDVSEPDWSSAPNPGDSVSDADVTWYNAGLASAFPPAPTTWQAETEYDLPAYVYPSTPNGHLYAMFAPGPLTSDVSEPTFPTDGTYVSDNDGYWWDCGYVATKTVSWETLVRLVLADLAGQGETILEIQQTDEFPSDRAISLFNAVYGTTPTLQVNSAGTGVVTFTLDNALQLIAFAAYGLQVGGNDMFNAANDSMGGGAHAWVGGAERDKTMLAISAHPNDNVVLALQQDPSGGQSVDLMQIYAANGTTVLGKIDKDGVLYAKLPTVDPGGGMMWNDGGTVKVGA